MPLSSLGALVVVLVAPFWGTTVGFRRVPLFAKSRESTKFDSDVPVNFSLLTTTENDQTTKPLTKEYKVEKPNHFSGHNLFKPEHGRLDWTYPERLSRLVSAILQVAYAKSPISINKRARAFRAKTWEMLFHWCSLTIIPPSPILAQSFHK